MATIRSAPVHVHEVGRSVAGALAGGSAVVVVVGPGGSVDECVDQLAVNGVTGRRVRALRTDRDGAFRRRWEGVGDGQHDTLVAVDLQWADSESLVRLCDVATRVGEGCPGAGEPSRLVLLWRSGLDRPELGELRLIARRSGVVVEVVPYDIDALIARGEGAARAGELVSATLGVPDLVLELERSGSLEEEVTARLAVLDEASRVAAEFVAFGADPAWLADHADLVDSTLDGAADRPVELVADRIVGVLTVEGLLAAGGMPPAVAAAVRRASRSARRARVVGALVADGRAGATVELARLLLELGDRSPVAGEVYLAAAEAVVWDDPVEGAAFATAAAESAADERAVRLAVACARLGTADPVGALRELHGLTGTDVELMRATAWVALGDLAAAEAALARSGEPALSTWAAVGTGSATREPDEHPRDGSLAASTLAAAVLAWGRGSFGSPNSVLDELGRAVRHHRTDPDGERWPITPDLVHVAIALTVGAFDVAQHVAASAMSERPGGAMHHRLMSLVAAWIDARRGLLDAAAAALGDDDRLPPHARFVREAARCAVAVRDAEAAELDRACAAARDAAAAITLSLYELELVADVEAAASRSSSRFATDLFAPFEAMIDALGSPAHLRFEVAWSRLRATLAGDDMAAVVDSARSLVALDPVTVGHALAGAAHRAAVLLTTPLDEISAALVIEVAQQLADLGAPHEAARLCGLLATVTGDEGTARQLLRESRTWRSTRTRLRSSAGTDRDVVRLSEQETRVGQMVLEGHTHKQIGAALFVSPKTVEHHVAHIRTKLGCRTRAEMMSALRDYLATAHA